MRVLILGIDGYIGWALANKLIANNYTIMGVDDLSRRRRVNSVGSDSIIPIEPAMGRRALMRSYSNFEDWIDLSLGTDQPEYLRSVLKDFKPNAIFHLAEQPSAPWSMQSVIHASVTQMENVIGTLHLLWAMKEECPNAHLIKLGTMGEYGTPECDIPEGEIPKLCINSNDRDCMLGGLPFPRSPGSFYHLSKVHDTHNIIFACKTWGLRSTDIMQGVVFGVEYNTRLDYDEYFGTVINRFCAQAVIGHPLTVYGTGGQTRGFLPLKDSLQCLKLILENPPIEGTYRTFNQFGEVQSINYIADRVKVAAAGLGIGVRISSIFNPRIELEDHYYNPANSKLIELGYRPSASLTSDIADLIKAILPNADRINSNVIKPKTTWK